MSLSARPAPSNDLHTQPRRLPTRMVEKVWGRDTLPAPFAAPGNTRIGEIWFEPPAQMSGLLVKYLFTSEKLSVQVHPSSVQARGDEAGKEECWLVLDAEPGSQLAIGFDRQLTPETVEAAALNGTIEDLLTWHDVAAGDVFHLPAGTVHAIGPGLSLVEVQQNSDTTFRMFDYGRPRELHLERAVAVADTGPYPAHLRGSVEERGMCLVESAHFRLDRVVGAPGAEARAAYPGAAMVLPLSGAVCSVDGAVSAGPGECLLASDLDMLNFSAAKVTLLTRTL